MTDVDLLQELGVARSALGDVIANATGPSVKTLLQKRDAVTWAMNRVVDARLQLALIDTSSDCTKLAAIATQLDQLAATEADVTKAIGLADQIVGVVSSLLPVKASLAGAKVALASSLHTNALALAPLSVADAQLYTASCNTHGDLPQVRVSLLEAQQNESDHVHKPENAGCTVTIAEVR